jgi:putative ABC transport system substrate-binding protein
VLANPVVSYLPFEDDALRAGKRLGLAMRIHHVSEPADLEGAFSTMKAENAQAVFVLRDMMLADESPHIASLALQHGLPTMTWANWYTEEGCLMAYSAQYGDLVHRLAYYVDRILKGAKPGDLPIEQPTEFELSINLQTAAALGIELPPALLLRADEVIE